MPTTTKTGLPVPELGDEPNVPSDIVKLGLALDSVTVPVFATTVSRDAAIAAGAAFNLCIVGGNPYRLRAPSDWQPLRDAKDAAPKWACYANSTTAQTFVSDTSLRINFLTTIVSQVNCPALGQAAPGNMWIPITYTGWYSFQVKAEWGVGVLAAGARGIALYNNIGAAYLQTDTEAVFAGTAPGGTKRQMVVSSGVVRLAASDQIRMGVWQTSGVDATVGANYVKLALIFAE